MDEITKNNKHLMSLLEKYHSGQKPNFNDTFYNNNERIISMQTEIDVRDLRIRELEEDLGSHNQSINLGRHI